MLPEWTHQQRIAMQVIGIPLWQKKGSAKPAFYYRLGPLYLRGPEELPVSLPDWFNDLCFYFEQRPVAVKAPSQTPELCFSYTEWLQAPIAAATKKALWQQLLHAEL